MIIVEYHTVKEHCVPMLASDGDLYSFLWHKAEGQTGIGKKMKGM